MKSKLFHCRGKIAFVLCVLIAFSLFLRTLSFALSDEEEYNRAKQIFKEGQKLYCLVTHQMEQNSLTK